MPEQPFQAALEEFLITVIGAFVKRDCVDHNAAFQIHQEQFLKSGRLVEQGVETFRYLRLQLGGVVAGREGKQVADVAQRLNVTGCQNHVALQALHPDVDGILFLFDGGFQAVDGQLTVALDAFDRDVGVEVGRHHLHGTGGARWRQPPVRAVGSSRRRAVPPRNSAMPM